MSIRSTLSVVLLCATLVIEAQPFAIGNSNIVFQDPERNNRNIPTQLYYPSVTPGTGQEAADGSFPVIIIGHGFLTEVGAYQNYVNEYVPKGYIVALPTTEGSLLPNHGAFGKDLAYLVTGITQLGLAGTGILSGHVQTEFAIMGHSMGGGASFLAAEDNEGIATVIGLSPAETNTSAIGAAAGVTVPTLIFSGSADGVTPIAQHSGPIYDAVNGPCKQHIILEGGGHCNFANYNFACSFGEVFVPGAVTLSRSEQHQKVYTFLTPWLDARLKGNTNALQAFFSLVESESEIITEQSDCTACPIPEGLASLRPALDEVSLSWDAVSAAESYEVRGRIVGTPVWLTLESAGTSLFADDIPLDQQIEWQVRTVCDNLSDDRSPYSESSYFNTACPMPEGLTTSVLGPNSASASWNPVPFAESYVLNAGLAGQGLPLSIEVSNTQFTTGNLQANTAYEWSVSARCTSDLETLLSPSSAVQSLMTDMSLIPQEISAARRNLVFPNPTSGWIEFSRPDQVSAYRLLDSQGRLLKNEASNTGIRGLDLTHIPNGVYILEIWDSDAWKPIRVIRE